MAAYKPASASITQGKSSKSKDPNAPKKPIQAFQFYRRHLVETDADFKALSFGEQSQELSTRWSALSKTDKEEYNAAYQADKKRWVAVCLNGFVAHLILYVQVPKGDGSLRAIDEY